MSEPVWVEELAAIAIHNLILTEIGGSGGLRDRNLLISALNRPRDKWHYGGERRLPVLAATYAFALIRNHPFIDTNKRVAFAIADCFLETNGSPVAFEETTAFIVVVDAARGALGEDALAAWYLEQSRMPDE